MLSQIRAEAELLEKLPASPARDELEKIVTRSAQEYVDDLQGRPPVGARRFVSPLTREQRRARATMFVFEVVTTVGAIVAVWQLSPETWMGVVLTASILAASVLWLWLTVTAPYDVLHEDGVGPIEVFARLWRRRPPVPPSD